MRSLLRHLLVMDADETESGFDSVVAGLSRRGLLVAGSLGIAVVLFYVLTHLLLLGYEPGWSYSSGASDVLVMWDKLFLLGISVAGVVVARTKLGAEKGRLVLGILILGAAVAMIFDDLAGGHSVYSVGYLTVLMILAVGSVPFRPSHVLALCSIVLVLLLVGPAMTDALGWPPREIPFREVVYWIVCTALFVGIAALVYRSRFDQYVIQEAIEKADVEIRNQAWKLGQLEQLKSRFFAAISHEFRTPITLILGPAKDTLDRQEHLDPDARKSLQLIERSGRRLSELVDQLLDLSRLEEGRLPLHVGPYDLGSFVRRAAASFESLAESRGIELVIESDLDDPIVYFDAEQMQKVMENLLSNALKFTDDGGRIRVSARSGGDPETVVVSVKDNGVGIPGDELDNVFDRFHQVPGVGGKGGLGSGIGLALARELVEAHDGSIAVESELGFGSEFTITLRRGISHFDPSDMLEGAEGRDGDTKPLPATEPKSIENSVSAGGSIQSVSEELKGPLKDAPTILLVDDHPDMLAYLSGLLTDSYNIILASNGREGLEAAVVNRPDLIITDVMMPEMDGKELCAAVKGDDRTAHIPVIMVTAKASRESKLEGLSEGADDYILKPFDASELRIRVENLIEIRRALRQLTRIPVEIGPSEVQEHSADEQFIERISEIVEEHMGDTNFTVEWLADEAGLSRRQLERKVRQITRLTPGGFIRLMRLKRAGQLIEARVGTISEIAYRVGFNDPNYFSRLFRQTFGVPPSEYEADQ